MFKEKIFPVLAAVFSVAMIVMTITFIGKLLIKTFTKESSLISDEGAEILADKRNKPLIKKQIDEYYEKLENNSKDIIEGEVTVTLANKKKVTILV